MKFPWWCKILFSSYCIFSFSSLIQMFMWNLLWHFFNFLPLKPSWLTPTNSKFGLNQFALLKTWTIYPQLSYSMNSQLHPSFKISIFQQVKLLFSIIHLDHHQHYPLQVDLSLFITQFIKNHILKWLQTLQKILVTLTRETTY